MTKRKVALLALALLTWLASAAGNARADEKKELWVYTSIYKEFAEPIARAFEAKHPEYSVQVFQGGSEKIQAKVEAELLAQRPQADILLTSDPFWSQALEKRGVLSARPGHDATETNYYSVMVMICHQSLPPAKRPQSFADLAKPEFDHQIQSGSPLESGTAFTAVAILSRKYGWDYYKRLAANHFDSSGGNATVIEKVESGEKKIGIVLLENALAARKRGSPIDIIYPSDGAIPIPSVQVILKDARNPRGAAAFADFILSAEGQRMLRKGFMYSVRKDVPPPEGAPPFSTIMRGAVTWTPDLVRDIGSQSKEIKKKFADLILE